MHTNIVKEARSYTIWLIQEHCAEYPFHNKNHTNNVFERATYLAMSEWIDTKDLQDLQIAATFHDVGFIQQYAKNEYIGSQIAREWLEQKNYPEDRILLIEKMIMATVLFSEPKNILEQIIQDADLDNIGTTESFLNSQALLREIRDNANIEIGECSFWQFAYRVHKSYNFHTKTARKERNYQLRKNIKLLEAYLDMLGCEIPKHSHYLEKIV